MIKTNPFSPVDIRILDRKSAINDLKEICASKQRILFLMSENTKNRTQLFDWLEDFDGQFIHYSKIHSNPSIDDIIDCFHFIGDTPFDLIVAVGGGSAIDLAKAVSALYEYRKVLNYDIIQACIKNKKYSKESCFIDFIAIPTTSGTGSEVTKWATIWDYQYKEKLSVEHEKCFPKIAFIIPELTTTMNQRLTLSTGLDALSHAMEAFWAKKRNPLSQMLALDAIRLIKTNLPKALKNLEDLEARQAMSIASLTAGLAFSMTKTTACHSVSYPLTLLYDIEHGFAAALTLASIAKINLSVVKEINLIYNVFCDCDGFENWINSVTKEIQGLKLSDFGVKKEDIKEIAKKTFTQGRMDNNPVNLSEDDVVNLLNSVF